MKRNHSRLYSFILAGFLLMACVQAQAAAAALPPSTSKAVVFLLDASNSMTVNDQERLAKDSIAQILYSLPSHYRVGFAAYNTSVVSSVGMMDSNAREPVMEAVDAVSYTGYTNAGAGLAAGLALLDTVEAAEKTIVILSDGEIVMNSDAATAESSSQFQTAVETARTQGIHIHVIGLGAKMADSHNTIFSASAQTRGAAYHAPHSSDIQGAIDSILQEQLGVRKTRAAIVDTDGGLEDITVTIPSAHTSKARILLTSGNPIQNLKADFSAVNGKQYSGSHYALLELDHPTDTAVHITFQGQSGGQVKADVISEYVLTARLTASYTDSEPDYPEAERYNRTANLSAVFYDAGGSNRQMLTDVVFQGLPVPVTVDGNRVSCYLNEGTVRFQRTVTTDTKLPVQFDFTRLDTNLILEQPIFLNLEGPPALSKPPQKDSRPQMIAGALILLALLSMLVMWLSSRRKGTNDTVSAAAPAAQMEEASRYGYAGRLNIHITNTLSGRDFPPLTYNLFRVPGGKKRSLQEILDSCAVDEAFEGAVKYLKDCKFGYADVQITHDQVAFPYVITAFTHTNEEKTLIHSLDRENIRGFISRNMADLTLKLYLKDLEGRQRYVYNCSCDPEKFTNQQPEEIVVKYNRQIRQDDLDDIVDRELKFFVLADEDRWGFTVVPVLREDGQLRLGPDQFFRFETEGWVTNFFDGTK